MSAVRRRFDIDGLHARLNTHGEAVVRLKAQMDTFLLWHAETLKRIERLETLHIRPRSASKARPGRNRQRAAANPSRQTPNALSLIHI